MYKINIRTENNKYIRKYIEKLGFIITNWPKMYNTNGEKENYYERANTAE